MALNELSPNTGPDASPICRICGTTERLMPRIRFIRREGQTWGGTPVTDGYVCVDCRLNRRGHYQYNRYTGLFDVLLAGKQIGRAATFLDAERQAEDALRAVDDGETTLERLAAAWQEREAWIADGNTFDDWQVAH
jgi:hypothetical protein